MIGNLIIDRLKLAIPTLEVNKDKEENTDSFESNYGISLDDLEMVAKSVLGKHFKSGFKAYKYYKYFYIEFNPTRYYAIGTSKNDDVNLQMPPQEIFLELFKEIGLHTKKDAARRDISQDFTVVELNFTKNFIVDNDVEDYFNMLLNVRTSGMQPIGYASTSGKSVYFSYLKRNSRDSEYTGKRLFKFYCKTDELNHKKRKDLSNLKLREKLSEQNKRIFKERYSEERNTINLEDANLLRVELTYKLSSNLKRVGELLDDKDATKLKLSSLISHLKYKTLYANFDKFFQDELRKHIFKVDANQPVEVPDNFLIYKRILPEILLGDNFSADSEMYYLTNLLEVAGVKKDNIDDKFKILNQGNSINLLYSELYNLIFSDYDYNNEIIDMDLYRIDEFEEDEEPQEEENLSEEINDWEDEIDNYASLLDE